MVAITQAKTGRSKKKFDNIAVPRQLALAGEVWGPGQGRRPWALPGHGLDRGARPHLHHALDDHAVAGRQPRGHQPFIAEGSIEGELPLLDLAGPVHHQGHGIPLGSAAHPLLGHQDGLVGDALLHHGPDEHARQEQVFGVGDHDAQVKRTGGLVHRDVPELQPARQGIGGAVFQKNADLAPVFVIRAEAPGFQVAFQAQQFGG
jgi:hypothetical protein